MMLCFQNNIHVPFWLLVSVAWWPLWFAGLPRQGGWSGPWRCSSEPRGVSPASRAPGWGPGRPIGRGCRWNRSSPSRRSYRLRPALPPAARGSDSSEPSCLSDSPLEEIRSSLKAPGRWSRRRPRVRCWGASPRLRALAQSGGSEARTRPPAGKPHSHSDSAPGSSTWFQVMPALSLQIISTLWSKSGLPVHNRSFYVQAANKCPGSVIRYWCLHLSKFYNLSRRRQISQAPRFLSRLRKNINHILQSPASLSP